MSHYSGRLETKLASGILRGLSKLSLRILEALSFQLLEVEVIEGLHLLCSTREKGLRIGRAGRVLEDDSQKVSWKIPYFLIWECPSSVKD